MKSKVNQYIAMTLLALAAVGAGYLILQSSRIDSFGVKNGDSEASYADLKNSILHSSDPTTNSTN